MLNIKQIKEDILDILLPRKCLGCGREGEYICKNCELFLNEIDIGGLCLVGPSTNAPRVVSVWEYEGIIEKAIHRIKFEGCYNIINELVEKAFKKIELNLPEDTVITYVPMWPKKERARGFNPAELIAHHLGLVLGRTKHKPQVVAPLLEKTRDNRSQVGLDPDQRRENVRNVFRPVGHISDNILLVDDVYTTGATINEGIKVLRKAGAKKVWGFTLARKMRI